MIVKAGSVNVSVYYYIVQDASATSPGEPVTGLLFSDIETGGSASYVRQGAARVDLTLITLASVDADHADGGFILVDDTNMPGLYRCDYPDAAFVTGVDQTFCQIVVASANNAVAAPILVDIDDNIDQTGDNFAIVNSGTFGNAQLVRATTPANTLDISVTGEAGIDWNNIGTPAATAALTNTTVETVTTATNLTTNNDKTGYSLATTGLDLITSTATGAVELAKAIWDRVVSKANHDIAGSAGKRLRTIGTSIIRNEVAQGPGTGNNQIQLDTGASAVDGAYDPAIVSIVAGTGTGQTRLIFQYDGTTKTATVDRNWKVNPDATSEFNIIADAGREHVNEGLAQTATATTITLNTLASSDPDAYVGQFIFIRSGTGEDQVRLVVSYNGTTKVATVERAWVTNPDSTSGYAMLPGGPVLLGATTHTGAIIPIVSVLTGHTPQTGDNFTRLGAPAGASVSDDVAAVDAKLPTALVGGRMDSNLSAINNNNTSAVNIERSTKALVLGAAVTGTLSSTQMSTDLTETTVNHFVDRALYWTTGVLANSGTVFVTASSATGVLTFTATKTGEAPASGDEFVLV